MDSTTLLVCSATFIAVTSLCLGVLGYLFSWDSQIEERLASLGGPSTPAKQRPKRGIVPRTGTGKPVTPRSRQAFRLLMNDEEERNRLQNQLLHAGIYSPIALPLFLAAKLLLIGCPPIFGAGAGMLGWVDPNSGLLYGSLIGTLGLVLPGQWLQSRKRQWHNVIGRSLPDFLDLMVACLEAGLSAEAALQRVTDELRLAHPRLSAELSIVQAQIELGASSEAALKNFADRSDHDAIRTISTVLQQARRLGGGMAEAFRQQGEALRTRREHLAEEKAQQAAVKILLPTLLLIFPSIFVVLAGPAVIQLAEKFGNSSSAGLAAEQSHP